MRNELSLCVLACALAHGSALGETVAERLGRIEAETAVLKAQARKAEVQAQIANKNAEIAARNAEARRIAEQPSASAMGPQLRGVDGVGATLYATIEMPHAGLVDVKQGDTLADGSHVLSIKPSEVLLVTPARRRLRLVRMAPVAQQGGADPAALPPLPAGYAGGALR